MHAYSAALVFDCDALLGADEPLQLELLALDSGAVPHAEDAFLAELRAALVSSHTQGAELTVALALGNDALDLVDGPDGPWQDLGVNAWLSRGARHAARHGLSAPQLGQLASAFVAWLGHHARLSLHAQRLLQRRIAEARIEPGPCAVIVERALAA